MIRFRKKNGAGGGTIYIVMAPLSVSPLYIDCTRPIFLGGFESVYHRIFFM